MNLLIGIIIFLCGAVVGTFWGILLMCILHANSRREEAAVALWLREVEEGRMRKALAIELFTARRVMTVIDNPTLLEPSKLSSRHVSLADAIEVTVYAITPPRLSFRLRFTRDGCKRYADYTYQGDYSILWDESEEESEDDGRA